MATSPEHSENTQRIIKDRRNKNWDDGIVLASWICAGFETGAALANIVYNPEQAIMLGGTASVSVMIAIAGNKLSSIKARRERSIDRLTHSN